MEREAVRAALNAGRYDATVTVEDDGRVVLTFSRPSLLRGAAETVGRDAAAREIGCTPRELTAVFDFPENIAAAILRDGPAPAAERQESPKLGVPAGCAGQEGPPGPAGEPCDPRPCAMTADRDGDILDPAGVVFPPGAWFQCDYGVLRAADGKIAGFTVDYFFSRPKDAAAEAPAEDAAGDAP